jgi:DNA repair exonuclease SbcCD ATPase subunit
VGDAESALARAQQHAAQARTLRGHLDRLGAAQAALEQVALPPEPPSFTHLERAVARAERLRSVIEDWETAERYRETAVTEAARQEQAAAALDQEAHRMLVDAGQCPLCGQEVRAEGA